MVGKLGTVFLGIEAGGFGEVTLNVDGTTQLFVATSSVDIGRGDSVLVIGRSDDNSLVVDAWFPELSTAASLHN